MTSQYISELDALRAILQKGTARSQEHIVEALRHEGFEVNQSKVSRLLQRLAAQKVKNEQGQTVYVLQREPAPPSVAMPLHYLIRDIVANEQLILVQTSPGAASLVARMIDYDEANTDILGTIAGDDTILVIPKRISDLQATLREVKTLLT